MIVTLSTEAQLELLKNANKSIQEVITKTAFPYLDDALSRNTTDAMKSGYNPDEATRYTILERTLNIPFPDALFKQYDFGNSQTFMGIFEEIKRVWLTVDHLLFLWDYER